MIVFYENFNDIQQTLDQVKIGNNLKTIVVTSEDNFEVFLETLAQFQENSHFIICSYENKIEGGKISEGPYFIVTTLFKLNSLSQFYCPGLFSLFHTHT